MILAPLKKKKIILVNQSYSVNRTGPWGPFSWCSSLLSVAVVTWGLRRGGTVVLQKKKQNPTNINKPITTKT